MSVPHVDGFAWESWKPAEEAVLCFIQRDGKLALIHKKRGLGAGKINGPGGRIEPGETDAEAAVRETQEEIGLTPVGLRLAGNLSFLFTDGYGLACSVFHAPGCVGTMGETPEAAPFWCAVDRIPFDKMWADDRVWFPHMLAGRFFRGYFVFDGDIMLSHRLETV